MTEIETYRVLTIGTVDRFVQSLAGNFSPHDVERTYQRRFRTGARKIQRQNELLPSVNLFHHPP